MDKIDSDAVMAWLEIKLAGLRERKELVSQQYFKAIRGRRGAMAYNMELLDIEAQYSAFLECQIFILKEENAKHRK